MVALTLDSLSVLLAQATKKKAQLAEQLQVVKHNQVLQEFAKLKECCKKINIKFNIEPPSFWIPKFAKENKKFAGQLLNLFNNLINSDKELARDFFISYPELTRYMFNAHETAIASNVQLYYLDPHKHDFIFLFLDNLNLYRSSILPKQVEKLLDKIMEDKNYDLFTQLLGNRGFRETIGTHKKLREKAAAIDAELLALRTEQLLNLALNLTNQILPKDFLEFDTRLKRASGLTWAHYTEVCQRVNNFICLQILEEKNHYIRNYVISQWLILAYQLHARGDFSLSFFITQALKTKEVYRLIINQNMDLLSKPIIDIFNQLSVFYSEDGNYRSLRAAVESKIKSGQVFVPPLPLLSKDARFAVDGNAHKVAKNGAAIGVLSSLSLLTSFSQAGTLDDETKAFFSAAEPAKHPLTSIEDDSAYLQGFLKNIYQEQGFQRQFSFKNFWNKMVDVVGVFPKIGITTLGFAKFLGKDSIDDVFDEYKYAQSQKILSQADKKDKNKIAQIKNDIFLDKYINSLVTAVKARIPVLAKVNEQIKTKRQELFLYATELAYQHALLNLGSTPNFTPEELAKLSEGNPYAALFYSQDKANYIRQFVHKYFINWLKFAELHVNYVEDDKGNINPVAYPKLDLQVEKYLESFALTPEQKNTVGWFLSKNPEYLPSTAQSMYPAVAINPQLFAKLKILNLSQYQSVLTLLANTVPLFAKNLENLLTPLSAAELTRACREPLAEGHAPQLPASTALIKLDSEVEQAQIKQANIQQQLREVFLQYHASLQQSLLIAKERWAPFANIKNGSPYVQLAGQSITNIQAALERAYEEQQNPSCNLDSVKALLDEVQLNLDKFIEAIQHAEQAVKSATNFSPERLTPQMTPLQGVADLQKNIMQSLDNINKLPLFMFAQRLVMQLGTDVSKPEILNVSEWALDVNDGSGNKMRLQKVSRGYLIGLLFDYINMFNSAVSRLGTTQPNTEKYSVLANLSDENHALTRTQRIIQNILHKLDYHIPLYLLLQPTFKEQMEVFHHNASDHSVVYGHSLTVLETAFYLSSKAFREIAFPGGIVYLSNAEIKEPVDLKHCTTLKQVLMHLTEQHYQDRHYSNQEQLQIMHNVLQLTFSKLSNVIKRHPIYEPTLQQVNVVHSVDGSSRQNVLLVLQHWHSLYQMNGQLPTEQRIDMSSFTGLFKAEKMAVLAESHLTTDLLQTALHDDNSYLFSSSMRSQSGPCAMEVDPSNHNGLPERPPLSSMRD